MLDLGSVAGKRAERRRSRTWGAVLLVTGIGIFAAGVAVFALGRALPAPALLTACAAIGFGLTYLAGIGLTLEERLAFGIVLGGMAFTLGAFFAAFAFGLGAGSVLVGLAFAAAASAPGWLRARNQLTGELADLRRRWTDRTSWLTHPWPFAALAILCIAYTVHLLAQTYTYQPDGLYAGYVNVWGDWAAHLAYAGSFAFGQNLPPEFPIAPGHRLAYPFFVDFFAATLVPLGASLTSSLVLSSGLLALAFPLVMYLAAYRLTGSPPAAALAVLVFLLGGGLGFVNLAGDIRAQGASVLAHLPREYTLNRDLNYQWLNPVLAYLLPQRSTLFGFSIVLMAASLLWRATRDAAGWWVFAFTGIVVGLAPLFHAHAYATVVVLAAFWTALWRRRQWVAFFVPALALGLPGMAWLSPSEGGTLWVQLGWMAGSDGHHDSVLWFWLVNLGLFIPLLVVAQLWPGVLPDGLRSFLAPLWLWFLVPNVLVFQPWIWDNTKFFVFWAIFGAIAVGALLAKMARRGAAGLLAATGCFAVLCLAGALDLTRAADLGVSKVRFTDAAGLDVASWVRGHTEPRAIFLVAPEHNQPVAALAGRRVVVGYAGWIWSYHLESTLSRVGDVRLMLHGDPDAADLARSYGVRYVVIGPQELAAPYEANTVYWSTVADRIYDNGVYAVYRLT